MKKRKRLTGRFTALKLKRWRFLCRSGQRRNLCINANPSQGLRNAAACSVTTTESSDNRSHGLRNAAAARSATTESLDTPGAAACSVTTTESSDNPSHGLRNAAAAWSATTESLDAPVGLQQLCNVTEEVLNSDEALWELYKSWCVRFARRTQEDMERRFKFFKRSAITVHEMRKENRPYGLTLWADETDVEWTRRRYRRNIILH